MKVVLMALLAAVLAGCDARASQVDKCTAARMKDGDSEGRARTICLRMTYGTLPNND